MFAFPLGNTFEKQTKKQADALKSLNLSNKRSELKQIESIFLKNLLNDLFIDKLKETNQSQNSIKLDDLEYTAKSGPNYGFSKCYLPIVFLRDINERIFSLKHANKEQSYLVNKLIDVSKDKIPPEEIHFQKMQNCIFT